MNALNAITLGILSNKYKLKCVDNVYFPIFSVFTWVLTRSKEKLQGELLKKVEDKLSKYPDLAEHRQSFVFKEFTNASCSYTNKFETDFFTSNFW